VSAAVTGKAGERKERNGDLLPREVEDDEAADTEDRADPVHLLVFADRYFIRQNDR